MLDYLASTQSDDGALLHSEITQSSDQPGFVEIHSLRARTALEEMGWEGFSVDDL